MLKEGLSLARANLSRVITHRSRVFTSKVRGDGDMSRRNGGIPLLLDGLLRWQMKQTSSVFTIARTAASIYAQLGSVGALVVWCFGLALHEHH